MKCLTSTHVRSETLGPCRYAEGLPEGLINNLERQLARYAPYWKKIWYYRWDPMVDPEPSMSISCSILELFELIELDLAICKQVELMKESSFT